MDTSWLGLERKTAVVTGGAAGIGRAIVNELLADGANVVVGDVASQAPDVEPCFADRFLYVEADVTQRESVERMMAAAVERFGALDILVNNAGINTSPPCWWTKEDSMSLLTACGTRSWLSI